LSVFLDPITVEISQPPFPGGPGALCRFLRELAREAWAAADEFDPSGLPSIADTPTAGVEPVEVEPVNRPGRHVWLGGSPWDNPDSGV
jgi:hypothetical protein